MLGPFQKEKLKLGLHQWPEEPQLKVSQMFRIQRQGLQRELQKLGLQQ
jgi:hypothetical protein